MTDVLVAGHVNWDVTLVVDRFPADDEETAVRERQRSGGGSAANVAAGLAELSLQPSLLGSVGDDEPGRLVREQLAERGVDVNGVRITPGETSTKYLLVAGDDVSVLGLDGVNEAIEPEDVEPNDVAGVEHVHLTGQRVATAERLAELAVEADCTVSLDPGRRAGERDVAGVLDYADVVFGTGREIEALYGDRVSESVGGKPGDGEVGDGGPRDGEPGDRGPEDGGPRDRELGDRALTRDSPLIVETSGAGGATCYDRSGGERSHSGFDVDVVDTTGAGDAFVAGFLSVWLDGGEHERALEVGNACGAIASRHVGARTDLGRADIESVLG